MKQTQIIQNKTNLAIIFIQVRNSSGIFNETYYYLNNKLIARKDSNNKKYFYHPDHLGSTSLITNSSGGIVEDTFYLPFGEVALGGTQEIKLFTGKQLDDTGFYYYGARYYDPYMTRFIQPDSSLPDVYDPQALNRYSYTLNNPYKYVDESGETPTIAGIIVTAVVVRGTFGALEAGFADLTTQLNTGEKVSWERVGKQTLKGFGKGAVMGLAEGVAIVTFHFGAIEHIEAAGLVWDIDYKEEKDSESEIEKEKNKLEDEIYQDSSKDYLDYNPPTEEGKGRTPSQDDFTNNREVPSAGGVDQKKAPELRPKTTKKEESSLWERIKNLGKKK